MMGRIFEQGLPHQVATIPLHIHQEIRSYQQDQVLQFLGAGMNEQASCVSVSY